MKHLVPILVYSCLLACGGPMLEGKYDVEVTYTRDDFPGAEVPRTTEAIYDISCNDSGLYRLRIVESSFEYYGEEHRHYVEFRNSHRECSSELVIKLWPHRQGLRGNGHVSVDFCNGLEPLITEATFEGSHR